jgi:glutathione S-transferase
LLHHTRSPVPPSRVSSLQVRRTPPEKINEEYLRAKHGVLAAELALWEMYLVGSDFLAGPGCGLSLADLSFFPQLAYIVRLGFKLEVKYKNLAGYFQRMCLRPSFLATWPPHWIDTPAAPIFASFYAA